MTEFNKWNHGRKKICLPYLQKKWEAANYENVAVIDREINTRCSYNWLVVLHFDSRNRKMTLLTRKKELRRTVENSPKDSKTVCGNFTNLMKMSCFSSSAQSCRKYQEFGQHRQHIVLHWGGDNNTQKKKINARISWDEYFCTPFRRGNSFSFTDPSQDKQNSTKIWCFAS